MNKTTNKSYHFYMAVTFLIAFLPRLILCFFSYPANFPGDEVTTAASAATAYGFDWSGVLATGRYYGQGFTILFTPLYYITNNPIILFRLMNMVYALLQALGSLIAFHCLRTYFKIDNVIYLTICAIGSSYLLETRATLVFNEHPLLLICWIVTWLLLLLESSQGNKRKQIKYTLLLVVVLVHSLSIHTRAVTFWVALAVTILIYFWIFRRWIVSLPVFAVLGGIGIAGITIIVAYIQKTIWSTDQTLANAHFNIDLENIKRLLKPSSWQAWANIVIGQINTVYTITCGMAVIGIVILGKILWMGILRKQEIINGPDSSIMSKFILVGSFFGSAVIVTIGGQSISWLPGVADGMIAGFGSQAYAFKAFTYFRYFGLYTGPLLMLVFAYAYLYKDKLMSYCKTATITVILLQAYFIICVVPYNYNFQEYVTTLFRPFVFFLTGRNTNIYTFLGASCTVLLLWIIIWISYRKKNIMVPALLVTSMLIYQYCSLTIHYDYYKQGTRYRMVDSSYPLMTKLQDNDVIPKTIYVIPRENNASTAPYFTYQFYLNHYTVIASLPPSDLTEGIAFHNKADYEPLLQLGYKYIKLDSNEYIYIKGDDLCNIIEEAF